MKKMFEGTGDKWVCIKLVGDPLASLFAVFVEENDDSVTIQNALIGVPQGKGLAMTPYGPMIGIRAKHTLSKIAVASITPIEGMTEKNQLDDNINKIAAAQSGIVTAKNVPPPQKSNILKK